MRDLVPLAARFLQNYGLTGKGVLVGVSGGVDSLVLLHVLFRLGVRLEAAHVNYGMRGAESDGDEHHVREVCRAWGVPLHVFRADEAPRRSRQAWARAVRYGFFERTAQEHGHDLIAIGHHREDQAETVLLNLFRGTGIEGLAGMKPVRRIREGGMVRVVRPFLEASREAILRYAREEGIAWREDRSNLDPRFRRAALRAQILPLLEQIAGPNVTQNVSDMAATVQVYLDDAWRPELADRFAKVAGDRVLYLEALERQPVGWRGRLMLEAVHRWLPGRERNRRLAASLDALRHAQSGRRLTLPEGVVWRDRHTLRFERTSPESPHPYEGVLSTGGTLVLASGRYHLTHPQPPPNPVPNERSVAWLDKERLEFPLTVRPWQPGDRIHGLGMKGTRLVSDLLTDVKVPPHERKRVCVVLSEEEIVWVAGIRISERARLRPETRSAVCVTFVSAMAEGIARA